MAPGGASRVGRARDTLLCLAIASMLAACGGRGGGHIYAAPGPPGDPWGPYIHEAGARFAVPETWIREVMRQESGGQQYLGGSPTTSPAGAMGLMQVMPSTYETLREEYGLGSDPYDPHDNIIAGTAYIREMYDRYGSPGFLAAYNAGPRRVDDYLNGARNLPGETRNYVAAIAPRIQGYAAYAAVAPVPAARQTQLADAMEPVRSSGDPAIAPAPAAMPQDTAPDSAASMEPIRSPGDPGYVPAPAPAQAAAPIEAARMEPLRSPGDPGMPPAAGVSTAPAATPAGGYGSAGPANLPQPGTTSLLAQARGTAPAATAAAPAPPQRDSGFHLIPQAMADTPPRPPGRYAIQVGAFASPSEARAAAEEAKGLASTAAGAETLIGPVARRDGSVLFRARLSGLPADAAQSACRRVLANGRPCTIVPPDGS